MLRTRFPFPRSSEVAAAAGPCAPATRLPSGLSVVSREGRSPLSCVIENGGETTTEEPGLRAGRGRSVLRRGIKSDGDASEA